MSFCNDVCGGIVTVNMSVDTLMLSKQQNLIKPSCLLCIILVASKQVCNI